jgi:hypothetical protein
MCHRQLFHGLLFSNLHPFPQLRHYDGRKHLEAEPERTEYLNNIKMEIYMWPIIWCHSTYLMQNVATDKACACLSSSAIQAKHPSYCYLTTKPPIWAVLWPSVPLEHCSGGTPLTQLPKKSLWKDSAYVSLWLPGVVMNLMYADRTLLLS